MLKFGLTGFGPDFLSNPENLNLTEWVDSFATDVVGPMGAGDALLAYSTLALAASESALIASVLGSVAAAVACGQEGNNPVSLNDVLEKLTAMEQRAHYE